MVLGIPLMKAEANKAGAGNGAGALSFHVGRLGRAVPDVVRSAAAAHESGKTASGQEHGGRKMSGSYFSATNFSARVGAGPSWRAVDTRQQSRSRTRRCSEPEPAVSARANLRVVGGCLRSLTFVVRPNDRDRRYTPLVREVAS